METGQLNLFCFYNETVEKGIILLSELKLDAAKNRMGKSFITKQ